MVLEKKTGLVLKTPTTKHMRTLLFTDTRSAVVRIHPSATTLKTGEVREINHLVKYATLCLETSVSPFFSLRKITTLTWVWMMHFSFTQFSTQQKEYKQYLMLKHYLWGLSHSSLLLIHQSHFHSLYLYQTQNELWVSIRFDIIE